MIPIMEEAGVVDSLIRAREEVNQYRQLLYDKGWLSDRMMQLFDDINQRLNSVRDELDARYAKSMEK